VAAGQRAPMSAMDRALSLGSRCWGKRSWQAAMQENRPPYWILPIPFEDTQAHAVFNYAALLHRPRAWFLYTGWSAFQVLGGLSVAAQDVPDAAVTADMRLSARCGWRRLRPWDGRQLGLHSLPVHMQALKPQQQVHFGQHRKRRGVELP